MGIAVKLQAFEGPLDLLLHLIEKNKVSIYDIPIAEITDQYMAYLHEMKKQDLGVMSEFLLMAATLLDIKSRMLLPKEVNEEGEEEDPRQELVQQLLEYKMYKYISYELKERRQDASQVLYHKQDLPEEVKAYKRRYIRRAACGRDTFQDAPDFCGYHTAAEQPHRSDPQYVRHTAERRSRHGSDAGKSGRIY